ncbi:MAG TPA: ABC transporter ATP-binding protein, partial [Balneola sp.]|nr:ABC transporter ATP-binding protein [Balneola sp.]
LALRRGKMSDYSGNYSFYERKWEEERELLINAQKNQEKELKETEEFIERFRYKASKARQVQSRVKQLEKIDRIEVEDELANVSFSFPEPERSGQVVMRLENIKKSYG